MENGGGERKGVKIDIEEFITLLFRDATTTFGTTHPDKLPADDPIVQAIYVPYYSWVRGQLRRAEKIGTEEAMIEASFKITPFLVEAGFTDPDYVREVVDDFLDQDQAQAEGLGLADLAKRIQAKRDELRRLLDDQ